MPVPIHAAIRADATEHCHCPNCGWRTTKAAKNDLWTCSCSRKCCLPLRSIVSLATNAVQAQCRGCGRTWDKIACPSCFKSAALLAWWSDEAIALAHPTFPLEAARAELSRSEAAKVKQVVYCIGGYSTDSAVQGCGIYDPEGGKWEALPDMNILRCRHGVAVLPIEDDSPAEAGGEAARGVTFSSDAGAPPPPPGKATASPSSPAVRSPSRLHRSTSLGRSTPAFAPVLHRSRTTKGLAEAEDSAAEMRNGVDGDDAGGRRRRAGSVGAEESKGHTSALLSDDGSDDGALGVRISSVGGGDDDSAIGTPTSRGEGSGSGEGGAASDDASGTPMPTTPGVGVDDITAQSGAGSGSGVGEGGGAVAGHRILIVGGRNAHQKRLKSVEEFNTVTRTWSTKARLVQMRSSGCCVATDKGTVLAIGGHSGHANLQTVEAYNSSKRNSWSKFPPLKYSNSGCSAVLWRRKPDAAACVVVLGHPLGSSTHSIGGEMWDPEREGWSLLPPPMTHRTASAVCVLNNKIIIAGGYTVPGSVPLASVEALDPVTMRWSLLEPMPTARFSAQAAVVDGCMLVIGGCVSEAERFNVVEAYNPDLNAWTTLPSLPTPRSHFGVAVLPAPAAAAPAAGAGDEVGEGGVKTPAEVPRSTPGRPPRAPPVPPASAGAPTSGAGAGTASTGSGPEPSTPPTSSASSRSPRREVSTTPSEGKAAELAGGFAQRMGSLRAHLAQHLAEPAATPVPGASEVCREFQRGFCAMGGACPHRHEAATGDGSSSSGSSGAGDGSTMAGISIFRGMNV